MDILIFTKYTLDELHGFLVQQIVLMIIKGYHAQEFLIALLQN